MPKYEIIEPDAETVNRLIRIEKLKLCQELEFADDAEFIKGVKTGPFFGLFVDDFGGSDKVWYFLTDGVHRDEMFKKYARLPELVKSPERSGGIYGY